MKTLPFPAVGNKRDSTKMTTGPRLNSVWVGSGPGEEVRFTKSWIAYLLPIREIGTIQLFVHRAQIRLLNGKTTDLDWYYSRHNQKVKFLIGDSLFVSFVKKIPDYTGSHSK